MLKRGLNTKTSTMVPLVGNLMELESYTLPSPETIVDVNRKYSWYELDSIETN